MAKDDYFVIVYKILTYFYECLKAGKKPQAEDYAATCEMFSIPQTYWLQIMRELIEAGYLRDIHIVSVHGGFGIKAVPTSSITMKGVEFLQTNSGISKARELFQSGFELLLSGIISRI